MSMKHLILVSLFILASLTTNAGLENGDDPNPKKSSPSSTGASTDINRPDCGQSCNATRFSGDLLKKSSPVYQPLTAGPAPASNPTSSTQEGHK